MFHRRLEKWEKRGCVTLTDACVTMPRMPSSFSPEKVETLFQWQLVAVGPQRHSRTSRHEGGLLSKVNNGFVLSLNSHEIKPETSGAVPHMLSACTRAIVRSYVQHVHMCVCVTENKRLDRAGVWP